MSVPLKPVEEQVIVLTGGTSGIGLATARMAAERGARVVIASRGRADLRRVAREIRKLGGEATYAEADVADPDALREVAEVARKEFGGFDTWVNNAGVSIYGRLEDVSLKDARRLFDTNYWGVVGGSLVAVEHLREYGGALINVGSVLSDVAIPLQGHYSASKHAVKGFTDALRVELEKDDAPISVSLVKPSSIDTPYTEHAKNLMNRKPSLPPPVYSPDVVARAILRCAERPTREITVGGGGRFLSALGTAAPRLLDKYSEKVIYEQQQGEAQRRSRRRNTLYRPRRGDVAERGEYEGHVAESSVYTKSALHPMRTALAVAMLGVGAAIALNSRGRGDTLTGEGQ